ncbi:MAG: bifunctional enoyl-CoA hydratase/phosphate acetyltransferase [Bacteroidales bacterium]|nr:bifunctional enoyl-CoA hydratase/phosphate acetyltransferase [Bacteroidales bacterium]
MLNSLKFFIERASNKTDKKRIVIAAAEDEFVLRAIQEFEKLGCITPIFVGDRYHIRKLAAELKFTIREGAIIPSNSFEESGELAVSLIRDGEADILMKGLLPTRTFIKAIVNKDSGISHSGVLSHLAIFEIPAYPKLLGITDAAMNIAPDILMKGEIIRNAVNAFNRLGMESPKVALLAAAEKVNPKIQATTDAEKLVSQHSQSPLGNCVLEGPLALDLAVSSEAAEHKGISSRIAGDADILIAPDLNSGNILYKSLTYLGNSTAASILLGADAPIILTSRADSPESKYYSIALAVCLC